jgi:hypothetical protein
MSCCEDKNKKKPFTQFSIVEAGTSVIRHFVDPTYNAFADKDIKNKRIKTCDSCENIEEFFSKKRCKICLCFIEAKASLIDQTCPHPEGDRWLRKNESQ